MDLANRCAVNYFLAVLGELLQKMDEQACRYSIALPDLPQFRGLWDRLPREAKKLHTRERDLRRRER